MSTADGPPPTRTDLRAIGGHESWRGARRLLEGDPSIEPDDLNADTRAAGIREDRPGRYRRKHAQGVSS